MDTLNGTTWDVVIVGTDLHQSLLALALSRSGKKVLHIDRNDYYGGAEAALSLQEADDWVKAHQGSDSSHSCFSKAELVRPDSGTDDSVKLSFSRAYNLSLSPQSIYARSEVLPLLVSSRTYRQLEFLAVGSYWVYGLDGQLTRVPSSREDVVFSNKAIDLSARRKLMKFLKFIGDYENEPDVWESQSEKSFPDFLVDQFKIPAILHDLLLALTLSPNPPKTTSTAYALPRIARHLRSIGVFGRGFGAVIPKWGGLAEITQVACRAGAVGGGVYVLGKGLSVMADSIKSTTIADEDGANSRPGLAVNLEGDDTVNTKFIAGDGCGLPTTREPEDQNAKYPERQTASRSISVVSSPLASLLPLVSEDGPPPAAATIIFPGSCTFGEDKPDMPPVYISVHSSDTGECPVGQSVLYASTSSDGPRAFELLDAATNRLLEATNETPKPSVLWSLRYQQRSGDSNGGQTVVNVKEQMVTFPLPSLDLAFDDSVIDRVKVAWQQIMGPDATGFMVFKDREGVGEDDDED
ncbi:hypothetical protein K402DRAFT_409784 [Aulographum hederae CBS 113979]|uniref:Rab proteins geranylgeranyltransferase n=1 Tax=Aulographum hederae CBS 113979 TaxID=1176131 RepID=A0A6G1HF71_9PEZI|nr:hypothetical protein K402DRAFT_409784 [Aulographum hederae CBS 113979]